jgi:hypothetical protein
MGEPGASIISEPEAIVTLNEVFDGFKGHLDGHRISTELTMLELLRKTHPDFHVTCTSPSRFDLLGYAAAGLAKVKLDCDESTMDATRTYKVDKVRTQSDQSRYSILASAMGFDTSVRPRLSNERHCVSRYYPHRQRAC